MIISTLLIILATSLLTFLTKRLQSLTRISLVGSTIIAALLFSIGWPAMFTAPQTLMNGTWFIDPFVGLLLVIIGFVQWTAVMFSIPYMSKELEHKEVTLSQVRIYFFLVQLFVLSMVLTVLSNNIGIMWVALEGTTLATTMLVAFYTREGSLEAAWKYILVCSVGISLGLLGVMMVYYAVVSGGLIANADALTWTSLRQVASSINPVFMRLAFVFIFLGYGAKVGLVPMHTWLPDAHGRTPSPMSAMLSGVLLNIALYAILRFKAITDIALGGSTWTNHFFLVFGAISFIVPAAFIIGQRNYKRMLAYSSIEHMGLIVFALGLGLTGMIAALMHLVGHALIKSWLFYGTGNVLLKWHSTKFDHIGAVAKVLPYTGGMFLIGLLALLAVPPSPIFMAEYLTFSAAVSQYPRVSILLLGAGALIFGGMLMRFIPFLFSEKVKENPLHAESKHEGKTLEPWNLTHTAISLHIAAAVIVGITFLTPNAYVFFQYMATQLM